jgi:hypothetical protein
VVKVTSCRSRERARCRLLVGRSRASVATYGQMSTGFGINGSADRTNHASWILADELMFDSCCPGQHFKVLTVCDEFSRECLDIGIEGGVRSGRAVDVHRQLASIDAAPEHLRSDSGREIA